MRMQPHVGVFPGGNLGIKERNGLHERLFGFCPMLLAHLSGGNLTEIDGVGRVVSAGPYRGVAGSSGGLCFREFLLREIAIADVAVGEEKKLIFGNVEGRFLGEGNHFGLVALDDFSCACALSLESSD